MAAKIIWTEVALADYQHIQEYLLTSFGEPVLRKFLLQLLRKIALVQSNPKLFPATSKRKNIRKAVINKRVILFYRIKSRTNVIELLSLWNTRKKR